AHGDRRRVLSVAARAGESRAAQLRARTHARLAGSQEQHGTDGERSDATVRRRRWRRDGAARGRARLVLPPHEGAHPARLLHVGSGRDDRAQGQSDGRLSRRHSLSQRRPLVGLMTNHRTSYMTGTQESEYDAIVIGSGITGGWAAKELTEKGLRTLMIERGREVVHGKDYTMEHK